MYRTFIALFTLLLIVKLYEYLSIKFVFLNKYLVVIVIILLLILFIVSYRKQVNYIKKRVKNTLNLK